MHQQKISQELQDCIENCKDCHQVCVATVQYCLEEGGAHVEAAHLRLMLDCAEICTTAENYMSRGSQFYASACGVCADLCDACATSCEAFKGDAQMKVCADICHTCAQSCRTMSTATRKTP